MSERDDELGQVLRPWMQRHAPAAPSDLVLRIYEEIEAMPEHAPSRGWLSRFAAWPAAFAATAAAAVVVVVAGAMLISFSRLPAIGDHPTPTPTVSPAPSDPTAVADALIAAWNSGDGQQAVSLYSIPQNPTTPIVRMFVDSGSATESAATPSTIATAVTTWHAKGTVLARTGNVLTQGPYAAYPVTWTSSDGSFNGVEVLRLSTDQLVTEQYLIGASSATASAPPVDVAQLTADLQDAQNASNGSAAANLLAPAFRGWVYRDGVQTGGFDTPGVFTSAIDSGSVCCATSSNSVLTQGPFVVHTVVVTNATQLPGQQVDGIEILELDGNGQIEYLWRIDTVLDQASPSPTPGPSTGPTAIADALIAAWNSGDGQQAVSLYDSTLPSSLPFGYLMIDSGAATQQFALRDAAAAVSAWHAKGTVLTRTGNVLAQGPYAAYPVTWTSSDGSFNGVEVLRLSTDQLVTEQYLIGASSATATGTAAGTAAVNGINDGIPAIAARLGATSGNLFSLNASVYAYQDGVVDPGTTGRDSIASVLNNAPNPIAAQVGPVVTNGPFAVYAVSNPVTTPPPNPSPTGQVEQGFTVLELNSNGLIEYSWAIRAQTASTQTPAAPGG